MARHRGAVVGGCVGAALLGVALLGGAPNDGPPLDPRSDSPLGTSALVSLLEGLGTDVELSVGLPGADDDVALVLRDQLDEDQARDLVDWVRRGGTLVVTDPESTLTPPALPVDQLQPHEVGRGICTVAALDAVDEVDGGVTTRFDTGRADSSCFGSRDFAFVTVTAEGAGNIVAVGGPGFVTNERLGDADNAVLAAALLAPRSGMTVRFVDAPIPAGGGDKSLYELISDGVRRAGVQLGIAFVIYALWRAVRLGRPVREDQPVEIAGSELVAATGRLLERGRVPADAAEVLRGALRRDLRARLGIPADVPPAVLAEAVAQRTGVDPHEALVAIGDHAVTSDDDLVAVARAVASVHQEVLH